VGTAAQPVTLISATLLPVPGYPMPRLVHLGVHLIRKNGDITLANYWPPEIGFTTAIRPTWSQCRRFMGIG
jgi:hypothetical protein